MRKTTILVTTTVFMLGAAAGAQTHAPWPADWNNWNDPALWCAVGDRGNAADMRYNLSDRPEGYGAVAYTYSIGKFEVTAGQYTAFLNAVAATDTFGLYNLQMGRPLYHGCNIRQNGLSGSYTYSIGDEWANRPVNYINWGNAARFANWLTNGRPTGAQDASTTEDGSYYLNGARTNAALMAVTRKANAKYVIPTEDEWYKAAYYKGGSTSAGYWNYPTRSNKSPTADLDDVSGNNANYFTTPYIYPIDTDMYYTTVAGEFQNSSGPHGTFDQGGNVFEWNEANLYGDRRGLRGGAYYFTDMDMYASGRSFSYCNGYPSGVGNYNPNNTGFRVALVPEPTTLALVALGGLAVIRKRRHML
ncbi:MAG: SUMF1/EgtB/PvdO family nonheme iron enzyme [Planctomycetota bacterium]|nr:SUMF1/EgtB/PvdO family nonheme iron enzyme [Planctomycetota bacterium]